MKLSARLTQGYEAEAEGDNYMRVRVNIDISQPLSRGRVVSLDSGKEL